MAVSLLAGLGAAIGTSGSVAHEPGTPAEARAQRHGSESWTRFGFDAARTNAAPRGLRAGQVRRLSERRVPLPGTADSSAIYLSHVQVHGKRRNLVVVTTSYGRTLALNPRTGARIWTFTPSSYGSFAGSAQITTASPVMDSSGRFVFAASPDGRIRKLQVSNGNEVTSQAWPARIAKNPVREKIGAALNLVGRDVLATTGGYDGFSGGDATPYVGKVVAIDRGSGRIEHVFNSLCSDRRRIIDPSSCRSQRAGIWGRAGAVVAPRTHRVYATTGNGPFNGRTDWGDSVLELAPAAKQLDRHFTPTNQQQLNDADLDLGSTSPALLPAPGGGPKARYLLQGGKDGKLRLLSLRSSLHGVKGKAGRRLGGAVQTISAPGGVGIFSAPAVLHRSQETRAFVATRGGTAAYQLSHGRLHVLWRNSSAGTSPVVAGSLLWVYDPDGGLNVYHAGSGHLVRTLPAPRGHWSSPIVANNRVYLPTGNANAYETSGELSIYHAG